MENKPFVVSHVSEDIFRIDFPPGELPVNTENWLIIGSYRLTMVLDKSEKHILAVTGKRSTLLSWLKSLGLKNKVISKYEKALEE